MRVMQKFLGRGYCVLCGFARIKTDEESSCAAGAKKLSYPRISSAHVRVHPHHRCFIVCLYLSLASAHHPPPAGKRAAQNDSSPRPRVPARRPGAEQGRRRGTPPLKPPRVVFDLFAGVLPAQHLWIRPRRGGGPKKPPPQGVRGTAAAVRAGKARHPAPARATGRRGCRTLGRLSSGRRCAPYFATRTSAGFLNRVPRTCPWGLHNA